MSPSSIAICVPCLEKNDGCENGDVRLQDGLDPFNGRLEICQYNTWGAVCTNRSDHDDALPSVVCRQLLGYDIEGCYQYINCALSMISPGTAIYQCILDVRAMKVFGMEDNVPVFLSEVKCSGSEQMLAKCSSFQPVYDSCSQGDIVEVTCGRSTSEAYFN